MISWRPIKRVSEQASSSKRRIRRAKTHTQARIEKRDRLLGGALVAMFETVLAALARDPVTCLDGVTRLRRRGEIVL